MVNIDNLIINICAIIISLIIFMIYLIIFIIHIKKPILKKGYFTIVFTQIILESFIILALLSISILSLIGIDKNINILFPIILIYNFCYLCDIFYNIQSLFILFFKKNKSENKDDLEYDLYETEEKNDVEKIKIDQSSYVINHIFSFLLSGIQTTVFYLFYLLYLTKNNDKDSQDNRYEWYFYFLGNKIGLKYLFFFLFNILYFISALAYCFKKDNINSLKLKNYSIYCLVSSLLNFIYPAKIILLKIFKDINNKILIYIYFPLTLVYLMYTCYYRLKCSYVQFVLGNEDKHFCRKFLFGLKIIFTCSKIPDLNFADFNSNFIFHALTGIIDIKEASKVEIRDTARSNSISILDDQISN